MGMKFLETLRHRYPGLSHEQQRDSTQLGVESLPTNVLIDRKGRPVQIYEGYSPAVPEEIRRVWSWPWKAAR